MSPRRWFLVGAFVFAVAVAIVVGSLRPEENRSDCDTVRQMLDFNETHNAAITQTGSNGPTETPISDYRNWASQLKAYANEVHDGSLAQRAEHMASLASQTVAIVEQARDDGSASPGANPPPWVQAYAQLNAQFKAEVSALETACPR